MIEEPRDFGKVRMFPCQCGAEWTSAINDDGGTCERGAGVSLFKWVEANRYPHSLEKVHGEPDKVMLAIAQESDDPESNGFDVDQVLLDRDQARALAAALLKWAGPEEKPATVRVRAAVGVTEDGDWCVAGRSDEDDANSEYAVSYVGCYYATYFIEATVPLPERPVPQTIEGEVVG